MSLLPIFQFTKLELTKAHTKGGTTLWAILNGNGILEKILGIL